MAIAASLLPASLGAADDLRLLEAVERRDAAETRRLLDGAVDVNARDADGATALHWAVYWDEADLARRLLSLGARADVPNDLGVTPVSLASANGNAALVEKLLGAGGTTSIPLGVPPIVLAARAGSADTVSVLVAHGADVNAREPGADQTALMWAVSEHHPDVVRVLLSHGADVQARTRTSKVHVNRGGAIGSFERPVPDEVERGGSTPLLFAARVGDLESARLLIDAGALVNDKQADGASALLVATHSGHGRVAELLLDRGANPNAAEAGYTALHAAVLVGDRKLVAALLAHKASPNIRQTKGNPVRRTGEDLVLPNSLVGSTPYYLAARFGEIEMMQMLIDAGADPAIRTADGTTPLMTAAGVGWALPTNRRGVDMTSKKSAWLGQEAEEAITLKAVQMALKFDQDVNASNSVGETALFGAVPKGFMHVIQLLVDRGARLDAQNRRGRNLLSLTRAAYANTASTPPDVVAATRAMLKRLGAPE
jgi:ankyrin